VKALLCASLAILAILETQTASQLARHLSQWIFSQLDMPHTRQRTYHYMPLNTHDMPDNEVTELNLPEPVGATTGNYALDVAPDGAVWMTSFDANTIIRYAPESATFTFYRLLVPNSVPFGMAVAPDGTIWFTSDGEPNDYIGHVFP
jgi:streptogramin lyase